MVRISSFWRELKIVFLCILGRNQYFFLDLVLHIYFELYLDAIFTFGCHIYLFQLEILGWILYFRWNADVGRHPSIDLIFSNSKFITMKSVWDGFRISKDKVHGWDRLRVSNDKVHVWTRGSHIHMLLELLLKRKPPLRKLKRQQRRYWLQKRMQMLQTLLQQLH